MSLAGFTTLQLGGSARWYLRAESADDIGEAVAWADERGLPVTVLAGGSNMVISDDGVEGLVLHVCSRGVSEVSVGKDRLMTVAAGESWDLFVARTVSSGLAGLECLSGIPGTVGGTPIQNVGAYGQEVASSLESITVYDRSQRQHLSLEADDCGFGYRTSRFKARDAGRFIVCDVTFRLRRGAPTLTYPDLATQLRHRGLAAPTLAQVRDVVLAVRYSKGMVLDSDDVDTRSVGSFFTNPIVGPAVADGVSTRSGRQVPSYPAGSGRVKLPAAWLLEQAGVTRGFGEGPVGISSKHALAVINRGGATANDVVKFAADIKRRVVDRFGISLVPEPTFVGFADDGVVKYLLSGAAEAA